MTGRADALQLIGLVVIGNSDAFMARLNVRHIVVEHAFYQVASIPQNGEART